MTEPQERIRKLQNLLIRCSYEYYVLDKPTMADSIYDALYAQLVILETQFPEFIRPESPTQRVGEPVVK